MDIDTFFERLRQHAAQTSLPAIVGEHRAWTYDALLSEVHECALALRQAGVRMLASLADNGPAWIVTDLAALRAGVLHIPLPGFFTPDQLTQALQSTQADAIAAPQRLAPLLQALDFCASVDRGDGLTLWQRRSVPVPTHPDAAKITFTSGSTGQPKGVVLSGSAMLAVAESLARTTAPLGIERHLNTLPLSVLLENIAGVYAPLIAGMTCVSLPLAQVGLSGSSSFDPQALHRAIETVRAQSMITLPQMLRAYAGLLQALAARAPATLSLVAVGGATVGPALLAQAHALGIPACEGYGLSEAASVQTLNLPGASRAGTAGRPLPHTRLRVAADGEIEVAGSLFLGYLGQPPYRDTWLPTGDLGTLDDAGYLHIQGRKKNVLITAFGRNVSPEWVETALRDDARIAQAVVLGEAQPRLGAVLWPASSALTDADLHAAVDAANRTLPDYAQIAHWVRGAAPFTAQSGLATANGRPRRPSVAAMHPDLFTDTHPDSTTRMTTQAMRTHHGIL